MAAGKGIEDQNSILKDDELMTCMDVVKSLADKLYISKAEFEELHHRCQLEAKLPEHNPSVVNNSKNFIEKEYPWMDQTLLIEKIFLRYHSDVERLGLSPFSSEHKVICETNPFAFFLERLAYICENDEVVQHIVRETLLKLKTSIFTKIVKTGLLIGRGSECAALKIFSPCNGDFEKPSQWDKCIVYTIPSKSNTASTVYWSNWLKCVFQSSKITDAWKVVADNWIEISSKQNPETMIPATLALLSIFREAKLRSCSREWGLQEVNLHPNVTTCMESINLEVRDCALIVAYSLADMHYSMTEESAESSFEEIKSERSLFRNLKCFYLQYSPSLDALKISEKVTTQKEEQQGEHSCLPVTDFSISSKHISFSEIYHALLEDTNGEDNEFKKEKYVLQIWIQLLSGMGIDADMVDKLIRNITEIDGSEFLSVVCILACMEMSKHQNEQVWTTISEMIFEKTKYNMGHRLRFLNIYVNIMALRAGIKCNTCLPADNQQFLNTLDLLDPSFFKIYVNDVTLQKQCYQCIKKYGRRVDCQDQGQDVTTTVSNNSTPTWQEVRDKRIEANTRRFASSTSSAGIVMEEKFSSSVAPLIWSSICNQFSLILWDTTDNSPVLDNHFLVCCLQFLQNVVVCTSQTSSTYYTAFAPGVKILLDDYGSHWCPDVREEVIKLCGIIVSRAADRDRIVEVLSESVWEKLAKMYKSETRLVMKSLIKTILYNVRLIDYMAVARIDDTWLD